VLGNRKVMEEIRESLGEIAAGTPKY